MAINLLALGALSALTGIAFGAFGAHGLKTLLSPELLAVYHTGVSYQMWHALGLILIALLRRQTPDSAALAWAGRLMFAGIVLFSGSLYLLALLNLKVLGLITPFGGVSFLAAWALVARYALQHPHHPTEE